jgi:hypothetical protein
MLEEAEEEDIVKGEKKLKLPSKICLKAAFTLFNVGQDHLGRCDREPCKFKHFVRKSDCVVKDLEAQLKGVQKKWFTAEDMSRLVTRASKTQN